MELRDALLNYYPPYALSVAMERAILGIDGFKPVQRRGLYCMHKLGLSSTSKYVKSARVVGDTMGKYHPHGDRSIYDALVMMTDENGNYNVPFVDGKGNYGAIYSESGAASMRYTEMKLTEIGSIMLNNIRENAVDMIPNFDNSSVEPKLLPSPFPNILVNKNDGVAVGVSSHIPTFAFRNVCNVTADIIDGKITNGKQLAEHIGPPVFNSNCFVHTDKKLVERLCCIGKATFAIAAHPIVYQNKIVFDSIPFNTTVEEIVGEIAELVKDGRLKQVIEARDDTGEQTFALTVDFKRNTDPKELLQQLYMLTSLRKKVSYRTNIVYKESLKTDISIFELINYWIEFRNECVERVYKFRYDKTLADVHELEMWKLIYSDIPGAVSIISHNTKEVAGNMLKEKFGLDDIQLNYLFGIKLLKITTDEADKSIKELEDEQAKLAGFEMIAFNENERLKYIAAELRGFADKYGKETETRYINIIDEQGEKDMFKSSVGDELMVVSVDKDYMIKRMTPADALKNGGSIDGTPLIKKMLVKNDSHIVVFLRNSEIRKIAVNDIDGSRGKSKDTLIHLAGISSVDDILFIDSINVEKPGFLNIIYPNGRGIKLSYSTIIGNRKKYKGRYDDCTGLKVVATQEEKFLMCTIKKNSKKGACCDTSKCYVDNGKATFKIASLQAGETFLGIVPVSQLPQPFDYDRYNKPYTVKLGEELFEKQQ